MIKLIPGILWFLVSLVLLTLPGSLFPSKGWLDAIQFDKMVHIGMFALLVVLWFFGLGNYQRPSKGLLLRIAMFCLVYGIIMEFVQKYWIPNRSFDVWDIVADGVGSFIPFVFWKQVVRLCKINITKG